MKTVFLDGNKIRDISDFHLAFKEALDFPDWYGNNLDALYDVLTDASDEIGIIAVNTEQLGLTLGRRWKGFLRLIEDVKKQRSNFYFTQDPFIEKLSEESKAQTYIGRMRKFVGHRPMLSAGATVVVIKNNKLLLNLRSDTNTWGIPGGAMELGETLEETAKRELKEETNLTVKNLSFLHLFSGKDFYFKYPNGDELYSVVALYSADGVSGKLKSTDAESTELKYFDKDNLPELESRAKVLVQWLTDNGILK